MQAQIILGAEDLSKIRLHSSLDPLDEMRFSAHELSLGRSVDPLMVGWARGTVDDLGTHAALLMDVMTSGFMQVSSLGQSIAAPPRSIDDALDSILSTPSHRWPRVIERLLDAGVQPGLPASVTDGQANVRQFVTVMRRFYGSALAPHWSLMQVTAAARRDDLAQILATDGIDDLLNRLHPDISWSSPVLTIGSDDRTPTCTPGCALDVMREQFPMMTIAAGGRGLILVPSIFSKSIAWWASAADDDNADPVVLTYPVEFDWSALPTRDGDISRGSLADLMGSTRSRLLETILDAVPTTAELADLCRISAASASEHATVLRRAGLITSRRDGHRVFHEATALGTALVQSNGRRARTRPVAALLS